VTPELVSLPGAVPPLGRETMRTSGVAPSDIDAVLLAPSVNSIHAVGLDYPEVAGSSLLRANSTVAVDCVITTCN
jgi:hypothetical protein